MMEDKKEKVLELIKEFMKANNVEIIVRPKNQLSLISMHGLIVDMLATISRDKAVLLKEWLKDETK